MKWKRGSEWSSYDGISIEKKAGEKDIALCQHKDFTKVDKSQNSFLTCPWPAPLTIILDMSSRTKLKTDRQTDR